MMEKKIQARLRIIRNFSVIILFTGIFLLMYMILIEDEPGLLPLLFIFAGTGGYFYTRSKMKGEMKTNEKR